MRLVKLLRFAQPQPYEKILKLQIELVKQVIDSRNGPESSDFLILLEHEPVITFGRRSHSEALSDSNIPIFKANRGGQITYHGPGQLVAYPILDLLQYRQSLQWYTETLAAAMCDTIKSNYNLEAFPQSCPSRLGVWLSQSEKVGFIGIQGQRWVVSHGCSVNLTRESCAGFKGIDPCGLGENVSIVNCEQKSGKIIARNHFEEAFVKAMQSKFNCKIIEE